MKILFALVLLIVIEAEAYPGWPSYPGYPFQNTRRNNLAHGSSWGYQQWIENQNNEFSSDVEWICQNPKTNDIMIIASDNIRHTPQDNPDRKPWWQWHNVPLGQREIQQGNYWIQPIIIIQETPNTDENQTLSPVPIPNTSNNNNNDKQTKPPPYHGGEGSIDIRIKPE